MAVTREEAGFYLHLLLLGIQDGYGEWLHRCLTEEEPANDTALELSWCFSDTNKSISLLNRYCQEAPFDEAAVADKLRLFFKEAYHSGRMTQTEITSCMHQAAMNACTSGELNMKIWGSMYWLEESLAMVQEGIISQNDFDTAFFSCLNSSIPAAADRAGPCPAKPERGSLCRPECTPETAGAFTKKVALLDRIRHLFRK